MTVPLLEEEACADLLHRVLRPSARSSLVLVVEGAAGVGKSHLVRRLGAARPPGAELPCLSCARPVDDGVRARWVRSVTDARSPALAVVEDVHAADPVTTAALRRLVRDLPIGAVLVMTCRPDELPVPGLLLGEPLDCPSRVLLARCRVGPLDKEATGRLAGEVLGLPCEQEAADRLCELTGGIAQVVVETLVQLASSTRQSGPLTVEDTARLGPPVRLAEAALSRTQAVAAEHRPLIRAAAVLAEPASEAELVAMSGLEPATGRAALLAALSVSAIDEQGPDRYGFGIPLAAHAVAAALPGPLRRDLHARAAHVLRQRQDTPWPSVAGHLRAAGRQRGRCGAVERALTAHLRGGRPKEAALLLGQTLADGAMTPADRFRLAAGHLRHIAAALPPDAARTLLDALADEKALPPQIRGHASVLRGLFLCTPAPLDRDDWLRLEQIVHSLPGDTELVARVTSGMSMPHWPGISLTEHRHWLEQADAAAAVTSDPVTRAAVAANRVSLLVTLQDAAVRRTLDAAPPEDELPEQARHRVRGLCNAADASVWLGRYDDARDLLDSAQALADRRQAGHLTGHTIRSSTLLLRWFTGDWAGLAALAEHLAAESADVPLLCDEAHVVLASLALARGAWPEAEQWLDRCGGAGRQLVPLSMVTSTVRIRLALAREDHAAACAEASAAWSRLRGKAIWAWAAEVAPWAVTAAVRAGRASVAQRMATEFTVGVTPPHSSLVAAAQRWCRAALAEARHDLVGAADGYRACADLYAAVPRPYSAVLATEAAAVCALAVDASDRAAIQQLTDAAGHLAGLGAAWDASRVRARVRPLVTVPSSRPGRPAYHDCLSPREHEVAHLAGQGLTNREIATTLHLSPRTVEHHVANAMRKLSVSSRRQLHS
uniref:helix-turn-helix transcriptional regulator n=1 Tax=Streptomyces sp. SAT1 TaxID=1849967 RepID=UPI00144ACE85|nr:LuxR C-terminal-related transcriptional regulator [Streptomyces sp. SAT1]